LINSALAVFYFYKIKFRKALEKIKNISIMVDMNRFKKGAVKGSTITIILLSIGFAGAGSFGIWAYIEYNNVKTDVEGKIDLQVAEGKRKQQEDDEKKYNEERRKTVKEFRAPEDLGKVTFSYPTFWNQYVESNGSDRKGFFSYFYPDTVPPVPKDGKDTQRFGLRVAIYEKSVDEVLKEFNEAIKKGELSSEAVTVNGYPATKIAGLFPGPEKNNRIRGTAYYFKLNSKTLMIRTDADTYNNVLNENVLSTLKMD